jgi:endonuclease/exonuclease/phosphatase (EEP) superfamily protein YafD
MRSESHFDFILAEVKHEDPRESSMSVTTLVAGFLLLVLLCLTAGSLLTLSSSPHWFIRGWDFPRVQIVMLGWLVCGLYLLLKQLPAEPPAIPFWPLGVIAIMLTCWHGFLIFPYTPVASKQSAATPESLRRLDGDDALTMRVVVSNVELENKQFDHWQAVIRDSNPDVLVMLEPDQNWFEKTRPLLDDFRHQILHPQDNWYGMALLSKLPIEDHQIQYLLQDDIPSIDAKLRMESGVLVRIVCVHPRPPEPIRDNDSTARDAELTLWGKELADDDGPIIICGDLNDVAWSQTTRLFLRTSKLLDPRRGRGFYNSFHARHLWMRFPLDHVFHSDHFTLTELQRLPQVGSDHFPICIDLRYSISEKNEHEVLESKEGDDEEIEERIERAVEDDEMEPRPVHSDD